MNIPSFAVMAKADARAEAFSGSIERLAGAHHAVDIRSLSQSVPLPTYMFSYHGIDLFHPNTPWSATNGCCLPPGVERADRGAVTAPGAAIERPRSASS